VVHKIVGIFNSAAVDGKASGGSSFERSPMIAARGSGDRQYAGSEIVVRVKKWARAGRL
jgi:hypothetical protein